MSTLYLHCGYHKTGSSFLQTMFARNRDILSKRSIHYPLSEGEYRMLKGEISPGNGKALSDALRDGKRKNVSEIIKRDLKAARENDCLHLLYSAEVLFHLFSEDKVLLNLTDVASEIGIDEIKALIYFRDPVSHALSTYKHRSKRGGHPDFESWVKNSYETMGLLDSFCRYQKEHNVDWCCRKYHSDSIHMAKSAFVDWIGTDMPEIPVDDRVNSSLTLSEIRILQAVKGRFDSAIPFLYNSFINLKKEEKSRDRKLNNYFEHLAFRVLEEKHELVSRVNMFLPEDEKICINGPDNISIHEAAESEISLTQEQATVLATAMKKTADSEKPVMKAKDFWRRGTRKIARTLKAKGY